MEKQAVKAQKVIIEAFGNCKLDDNQIPQALELIVKILEKIIQKEKENISTKGPVTEILNLYYVSEVSFNDAAVGFRSEGKDLESLLQKVAAKVEAVEAERKEGSGIKKDKKDDDDDETIVDEEDSKKKKDITKPTEKKTCPTRREHAEIEDITGTSVGHRDGIGVEKGGLGK
ncbi:hypothetical protein C2G38_2158209 [Gigaspora rosea]|uniref:Uncharacterized protein n=1 Tax=Gigaspora rosea TaxID=44941 RepID=A0A397W2L8_9GLOM|nr:hypothetical protein C2G38_2158209 [Gigaspora rosea]